MYAIKTTLRFSCNATFLGLYVITFLPLFFKFHFFFFFFFLILLKWVWLMQIFNICLLSVYKLDIIQNNTPDKWNSYGISPDLISKRRTSELKFKKKSYCSNRLRRHVITFILCCNVSFFGYFHVLLKVRVNEADNNSYYPGNTISRFMFI